MRRGIRAGAILVVVCLAALCAMGCGGSSPSWQSVVRSEIGAMLDRLSAAMLDEDAPTVAQYYCDPFVVIAGSTNVSYTRAEQQAILEYAFYAVDYLIHETVNRQISPGDTTHAVVGCDLHIKAYSPSLGTLEEIDEIELTLRKEGGTWRIAVYETLSVTPLGRSLSDLGIRLP